MRQSFVRSLILPGLLLPVLALAASPISLRVGWNLVGNGDPVAIVVATPLFDPAKITTVWKWNKQDSKWAFYTPLMTSENLTAYAQSKGYDVLTSIASKEGFWVNASVATVLTDPLALPPAPGTAAVILAESDLIRGWNLVASADNKNPSQLNTGLNSSLNTADKGIVTAWAWDAGSLNWKFYAPALEAEGGSVLANYISGKGYLAFSTAPSATDGFWMNIGAPTVVIAPTGTALERAKTFMATLRSNAKALNAADLSLKTELQAVADDVMNRTAPIAQSGIHALIVAMRGAKFWNDVIKNSSAPFVQSRNFVGDGGGGCGFFSDTDYLVRATSKADANYVACGTAAQRIDATNSIGQYQRCTAVGEWCHTNWSMRVRLHPDTADASKFTVYTHTRAARMTAETFNTDGFVSTFTETRTHYGAAFPGNAATLITQRDSNGQITALSLAGELSPAFSIEGGSFNMPPVATVLGDKHNVALSAALSKVGTLDKLALSGSIALIKADALETRIELAVGSYLHATTGNASAEDGSQEMLLKLKANTAGSAVTGDIKLSAFKLDVSHTSYIPTLVSFIGSVQRNGVSFFDGSVTVEALNHASFNVNLPRSSTNVHTLRVGFVGKVTIPARPILDVNLSVTHNDAGASSTAALSGQYRQGLITINLTGISSPTTHILTLESTEGVKLVIDESKTSHPLTVNGEEVGTFTPSNSRITYIDGIWEQF